MPSAVIATQYDARPSIREAVQRLSAAQKPGSGAAPYSRWINRRLGRLLAAIAARIGITPNGVTIVSACCTFTALGSVALVSPSPLLGIAVTVALLLGYALDAADGQLARLLSLSSRSGEWLDHMVDAAKVSILHGVVLISFYRFTDASDMQLLVAVGYQALSSVLFFGMILIDQLRRSAPSAVDATSVPTTPAASKVVQTLLATPADYAVLCLCFALIGWQSVFRFAYTGLFAFNLLFLLVALARWWRQVRALDRSTR